VASIAKGLEGLEEDASALDKKLVQLRISYGKAMMGVANGGVVYWRLVSH